MITAFNACTVLYAWDSVTWQKHLHNLTDESPPDNTWCSPFMLYTWIDYLRGLQMMKKNYDNNKQIYDYERILKEIPEDKYGLYTVRLNTQLDKNYPLKHLMEDI